MPSAQPNSRPPYARDDGRVPPPASEARREFVASRLAGLTEPSGPHRPDRRIGHVIADMGFAKRDVVEAAVELASRSGELTGEVLVKSGVLTAEQLARAVAE